MATERRNPWMGLASYQDPETSAYSFLFCGRSNESYDVAQLIENNIFVTLYGRSGTGKTSLLNAGVFPLLRKEQFLPVPVRLGMEAMDTSFQQCILAKIKQVVEKRGGTVHTVEVVPLADTEDRESYLWSHFARSRYVDKDENVVFPVVVLDQFEEVFRSRRQDAEALLRQIDFMTNETHVLSERLVDGVPYVYDFNFRFVVSIREDDLFRLEDAIDNNYLPEMKRCRFRLRNLSEEGAREVILVPGGNLFKVEDRDKIADRIIGIAREGDNKSVSSNILSLVCNRIFVELQRSGGSEITLPMVEKFIKGNPFERFYNEAMRGFSNREKSYIETHLVDSSGRRNSVPESDFLLHVSGGRILFDGDTRILQRVSTSSGEGNYRVELIHDSFCEPLSALKTKREKWERIKKRLTKICLIALAVLVFLLIIGLLNSREKVGSLEAEQAMKQMESGVYQVDGIEYATAEPTALDLYEWKTRYEDICREKLEQLSTDDYKIYPSMLEEDPCLVYLVLTSKSISDPKEKQNWFDLYGMMNQGQIDKLYNILYRETYRLAQIRSNSSSYYSYNERAYDYRNEGKLDSALVLINQGIEEEKFNYANMYDSKGQFLLEQGNEAEALRMWKQVLAICPDFLDRIKSGSTHLYEGLIERGLIQRKQK